MSNSVMKKLRASIPKQNGGVITRLRHDMNNGQRHMPRKDQIADYNLPAAEELAAEISDEIMKEMGLKPCFVEKLKEKRRLKNRNYDL